MGRKRIIPLVVTGLILISLPLTLVLVKQVQDQRSRASSSTSFVQKVGDDFYLDGKKTIFVGANAYWLGLSESPTVHYPSHYEIEDAILTVKEMGGNAIRSFGAISVGCSLCIEPSLNNFNPNAFDSLDYAIKVAKDNDIRLVLPLIDNYKYYMGGKYTFLKWRGISNDDNGQFFKNPTVISDFKNYISYVLNHVNPYTGLAYKDDPTIMVWETGNELYPTSSSSTTMSISPWTKTISEHIKSTALNQLVADGHHGLDKASYGIPTIDLLSHHNPQNFESTVVSESNLISSKGKGFLIGEHRWNWNWINNQENLEAYMNLIEANNVDMYMYWSLFPHKEIPNDSNHGYVQHGDGYTLHYPGDTADMRRRAQILRTHAFRVTRGQNPPPPHKVPDAPLMYEPKIVNINRKIAIMLNWRGVVAAASYSLEKSADKVNWTLVSEKVTDNGVPYTDSASSKVYYRVAAKNLDGVKGPYSNVVRY